MVYSKNCSNWNGIKYLFKRQIANIYLKKKVHIAEKANQGNLRTRCINYREYSMTNIIVGF